MHNLESVQPLPKLRAQPLIRSGLVGKYCVAACLWAIENVQESCTGGLLLVGYVGMPGDGVCALLEEVADGSVIRAAVHEVDLWIAFWGAGGRVDVVAAEVAADFEGVFDGDVGEVLVAEGNDFLFGDEEGKFVFLGVGELAELDAVDFGACVGS